MHPENESRTPAFGYYLLHRKDVWGRQLPRGTAAEFFIIVASQHPDDKGIKRDDQKMFGKKMSNSLVIRDNLL